ncbi:ABC1-domain-containing protein [Peniophora sp. CONT]|nr:ABC1-domain-containing protein [Peniophora sp. CONT]
MAAPQTRRALQSSHVPSSRIGRFFHYGGLAASLGYGAATELLRGGGGSSGSLMMTEANISRLVGKLSQMRGAALKVGQFLSIQDTHVLPPEVEKVFRRVQDGAHYMPNWQMEKVMAASLGDAWRDNFVSFDAIPFAAASIGQVHRAVLAAAFSPTGKDEAVAVKIQFPNIGQSVESDIGYLKVLLTAGQLLPKGLFLDKTIAAMKEELADECDYTREANFLRIFGDADHFGGNSRFKVPWVWDGSTQTVLVMEHVNGKSVGGELVERLSQQDKDDIASRIIELCLLELFRFRAMQTDPNWTNFLWNESTRQVELVDFGATRTYSARFMDNWLRLLSAAAAGEYEACVEASLALGYLTGDEEEAMVRAHVRSMQLLATPFRKDTPQPFAFGQGSEWANITKEIRDQIPVMLQHRLTPPPRETYSLNSRKLSGAFLLASRLGARVDCRKLWEETTNDYVFGKE